PGGPPVDANGIYAVIESPSLSEWDDGACLYSVQAACGYNWMTPGGHVYLRAREPGCLTDRDCRGKAVCAGGRCSDHDRRCGGACTPTINLEGSPNQDVGVDALLGTLAHELVEAITDQPGGYRTQDGRQNADLCNWQYGPLYPAATGHANQRMNG